MAEWVFHKHAPSLVEISSSTSSYAELNPRVVEAMCNVGTDITCQKPKTLTGVVFVQFAMVSMWRMDSYFYTALCAKDVVDKGINDPKDCSVEQIRQIRDQIEGHVLDLISKMDAQRL